MKHVVYLLFVLIGPIAWGCTGAPDADELLRARLAQHLGVWEGTYTYTTPTGALVDRHASRQEARLNGDTWHQRIVSRWEDGRERTLEFTAHIRDGQLIYDDPDFPGRLFAVTDAVALYLGGSTDGSSRLIETIVTVDETHQTRSWQVFEKDVLTQIVAIDEIRVER